jgi:predicted metalloprotease
MTRPRLLAGAALLLALAGGTSQALASAKEKSPAAPATPARTPAENLILGSKDSAQPQNMEQFLTAVTKDVDAYWTKAFKDANLPAPQVSYDWIPAGQTAASACGDENGTVGDDAAAYCPGDDTIYISQKFATDIYTGALDQALPGSSQGYGRTVGDFSVAYIVAHEYGHEVQDELGLFDKYGQQLPAMAFELQADCYAGTWAKSAYQENRLEDGDVQEALDAALAVGDFDTADPGHHGTPEQREEAWNTGFQAGDPSSCNGYLDPSTA